MDRRDVLRSVAGGLAAAIRACKARKPAGVKLIVEARSLGEVRDVIAEGADVILLDNMTLVQIRRAMQLTPRSIEIEVSGNVTPRRVGALSKLSVDRISVGALTHSARALDFSMQYKSLAQTRAIEKSGKKRGT